MNCNDAHESCCMTLVIECPTCHADIPARRARLVKVTCPSCGDRHEVNYGGGR